MELDLSSLRSVKQFSTDFATHFDRLDHVVFNAGIVLSSDNTVKSLDGFELTFATNHLGHFKLYLDLEDLITKSSQKYGTVTITHLSSNVHYDALEIPTSVKGINNNSGYSAYAQSKLANILFSNKISRRTSSEEKPHTNTDKIPRKISERKILSNAVHPGFVASNFSIEDLTKGVGNPWLVFLLDFFFVKLKSVVAWSAEEASHGVMVVAVSRKIVEGKCSGKYFHPINVELQPSPLAIPEENGDKFWKLSLELLHSKGFNLENTW